MSDSNLTAMPLPSHENSGNAGGYHEVKWEVVAQLPGITPATIVAGRLKAEGVPVRVWQEGAGQALGLTVGLLGTGYVAVPEEYANRALEILEVEYDDEDIDWTNDFENEDSLD